MATKAKHFIPEGYHTVTPYLIVRGAAQAIDFYKTAFGATELFRMPMPDGRLGHAEIRISGSVVMLADEFPDRNIKGPQSLGGTSVGMSVYVEDCDASFYRAVAAGAKVERVPLRSSCGRFGGLLWVGWALASSSGCKPPAKAVGVQIPPGPPHAIKPRGWRPHRAASAAPP